jgi:hypothetical protein
MGIIHLGINTANRLFGDLPNTGLEGVDSLATPPTKDTTVTGSWEDTDKNGKLAIAKGPAAPGSQTMTAAASTLWLLTTIVAGFFVFLSVRRKVIGKFFFFSCYFAASIVVSIARYSVLSGYGYRSLQYLYFYYFSDAVLTILLALAIWQISARLVAGRARHQAVLIGGAGVLLLVAWHSFWVAEESSSRPLAHFVFEMSRNVFCVAGLAVLILWARNLFNNVEDRVASRFVNVLAVYFILFFLLYGLEQARPFSRELVLNVFPMLGAWLPLGCSFALAGDQ